MITRLAKQFWFRMDVLAILAGVLYASWPLGFILNPNVARNGLASALEGLHQPYNWVFITGDVVSSVLITIVCWLIWRRLQDSPPKRVFKIVLVNIALFAAGTIIDALLPLHCEPTLQRCPNFTHDYLLLLHGLFSILAAICLFISLSLLWWERRHNLLLNNLMAGYLLFSLFSLLAVIKPSLGNWSQHYYLTLCGVVLALLPHAVRNTLNNRLINIARAKAPPQETLTD